MDWIQFVLLSVLIIAGFSGIIGKLSEIHIALINFATMLADLLERDNYE